MKQRVIAHVTWIFIDNTKIPEFRTFDLGEIELENFNEVLAKELIPWSTDRSGYIGNKVVWTTSFGTWCRVNPMFIN